MSDIKPCPFCNSKRVKMITKKSIYRMDMLAMVYQYKAYVRCMQCNARGPLASGKVFDCSRLPESMLSKYVKLKYNSLGKLEEQMQIINEKAINEWNKELRVETITGETDDKRSNSSESSDGCFYEITDCDNCNGNEA